jgi:hypothetical protein
MRKHPRYLTIPTATRHTCFRVLTFKFVPFVCAFLTVAAVERRDYPKRSEKNRVSGALVAFMSVWLCVTTCEIKRAKFCVPTEHTNDCAALETRVEIDEPTFRNEMRHAIWLLILLFFLQPVRQQCRYLFVIN